MGKISRISLSLGKLATGSKRIKQDLTWEYECCESKEESKLKYIVAENWGAEMPRNRAEMRASGSTTATASKANLEFMTLVMVLVQGLKFAQVGRISKDSQF